MFCFVTMFALQEIRNSEKFFSLLHPRRVVKASSLESGRDPQGFLHSLPVLELKTDFRASGSSCQAGFSLRASP